MEFLELLVTVGVILLYGVGISVIFLGVLYWFVKPKYVDPHLPGPNRAPLLGVTFATESKEFGSLGDGDPQASLFEWSKWPTLGLELSRQYGFRTWGGPTLNIGFGGAFFNICSPAELRHILKDNFDNYVKGKVARQCLKELLGTGIFTADGPVWKRHRSTVTALLSKDLIRETTTLLHSKLQQVEQIFLSLSCSNSSTASSQDKNMVVDFQDICYRMILDVFVKMAFGVELSCIDPNFCATSQPQIPFMQAFNELQFLCHQRFNDLFYQIKQFFGWSEREQKIRKLAKVIDEFADDLISKSRAKHHDLVDPSKGHQQSDIVSRFLQQAKKNNEPTPTNQELRDLVMNLVLAGRDSTACALSWAMYELTKHPTVADRIREESELVCGAKDDAVYTYETIQQLDYTHAVVMETLRLHSPVPDDFKFSVKDDILPDGTHIPAGSCVMYSPYTINHNPSIWGETADQFLPDRFLNTMEPSPFSFPTFNAGPRTCPGKPLALLEIKMALAYLLPRFDFIDATNHKGSYTWTLVMAMESGFPVHVTQRHR